MLLLLNAITTHCSYYLLLLLLNALTIHCSYYSLLLLLIFLTTYCSYYLLLLLPTALTTYYSLLAKEVKFGGEEMGTLLVLFIVSTIENEQAPEMAGEPLM